jgi:tetratricopeptide (TPR) repeat protein
MSHFKGFIDKTKTTKTQFYHQNVIKTGKMVNLHMQYGIKALIFKLILCSCLPGCSPAENKQTKAIDQPSTDTSLNFQQPEKLMELGFYFASQSNSKALEIADSLYLNHDAVSRANAFFIKGLYGINTQELEWALSNLDSSLYYNHMNADVHMERGIVLHDLNKVDASITAFEKVMEMDRLNPEVYYWLGQCYLKKKDTGKVIAYIKEANRLDPNNAGYRKLLNTLNQ